MKLSKEQLEQLKEEPKKLLVEAQKAWIYRLIDFAKQKKLSLICLDSSCDISGIIPSNWNTLYPEVKEQLIADGYRILGNPETDAPYDIIALN